jgi:hydroxyacylglutathione hydrolase
MPRRLPATEIDGYLAAGTPVVDLRAPRAFAGGHIPGALNIPYSKSYLTWAGWLLPYDRPFALIIDERDLEATVHDLQRIGLDDVAGFWTPDVVEARAAVEPGRELQAVSQAGIEEVEAALAEGSATVLDVRGSGEYQEGHMPGALSIPLGYIPRRLDEIASGKPVVVHCQTGVRSSIAASLLQRLGRDDVLNYMGSYAEWSGAGKPVERGAARREAVTAD